MTEIPKLIFAERKIRVNMALTQVVTILIALMTITLTGCKVRRTVISNSEEGLNLPSCLTMIKDINGEQYTMIYAGRPGNEADDYLAIVRGKDALLVGISKDVLTVNNKSKIPIHKGRMLLAALDHGVLTRISDLPLIAPPNKNTETIPMERYLKACIELLLLRSEDRGSQ